MIRHLSSGPSLGCHYWLCTASIARSFGLRLHPPDLTVGFSLAGSRAGPGDVPEPLNLEHPGICRVRRYSRTAPRRAGFFLLLEIGMGNVFFNARGLISHAPARFFWGVFLVFLLFWGGVFVLFDFFLVLRALAGKKIGFFFGAGMSKTGNSRSGASAVPVCVCRSPRVE